MNHDSHDPGALEQQMLEHYRRHSTQQPSAALDARILAAAQAHLDAQAQAQPQPPEPVRQPWLNRLHAWLFAGSPKGRWSVAFASLAVVGLGAGLSVRTFERAPGAFDEAAPVMAPAAPMASQVAEPDAYLAKPAPAPIQMQAKQMEKKRAALHEEVQAEKAEQRKAAPQDISGRLADQAEPALASPPAPAAAPFAKRAESQVLAQQEEAQLQRALQQILRLQSSGHPELAEQQLKTLQQLHPGRDLTAELQRLREP